MLLHALTVSITFCHGKINVFHAKALISFVTHQRYISDTESPSQGLNINLPYRLKRNETNSISIVVFFQRLFLIIRWKGG